MKCAVFYGKHEVRIEERPMPVPGPDEVLIQVKACGVCGTDVHIFEGDEGAAEVTPPTILGHEFSGVIVQTGEQVTDYKAGDRVCIDPNCMCGSCTPCREGVGHYCEHMIGYGTTVDGGFAEYCAVKARQVYRLGDNTTFEQGAMAEPVACCLHGIDLCGIRPGHQVVVMRRHDRPSDAAACQTCRSCENRPSGAGGREASGGGCSWGGRVRGLPS